MQDNLIPFFFSTVQYVKFRAIFKAVRSKCKQFFVGLKKTELDSDTGIFMRLWNVKNVVSAVLSTIIVID
jgi:hypothetical protein